MFEKRTAQFGPFRTKPSEKAALHDALEVYGISDEAGVARAAARALIYHAKHGDNICLPLRFRTVVSPTAGKWPICAACGRRLPLTPESKQLRPKV